MTSLITEPQLLTTAAADAQQINSAISQARAAAAGPTTSVVAAAQDEISAATAQFFAAYGQEYQGLLQQASVFHDQFAAALASAGNAYAGAEFAASNLLGTVEADAQGLLGGGAAQVPAEAVGLFMGGSGLPVPPPSYVTAVLNWVNFPTMQVLEANAQALFTPEGWYPLTGVKSLPFDVSVSQGVTILENSISQQLATSGVSSVSVLGYSQSAVISSLVMQSLLNGTYPGTVPTPGQLNFTLLGDPMAPNGGVLERFVGLNLPSLGLDFYGATPPNTPYPTNIYTLQYDGIADAPRYPIDFLSDLNSFAGFYYVHGTYPSINPSALPPGDTLITLPGSATLTGSGATNYYMITEPNLPLLDPVRAIPVIGNPLADLVQPDLTYLVNWGYGNPLYGYSTSPANIPTPFGVLPPLSDTTALPGLLVSGAQQGATAFVSDISHLGTPSLPSLSLTSGGGATVGGLSLPTQLPSALSSPDNFIEALQTANTTVTNFVTNAVAQSYAVLLPTADIANMFLTSVPAYDANLFLSGIEMAIGGDPTGGLIYAFGAPLAADTFLATFAAGFELDVIANAVTAII